MSDRNQDGSANIPKQPKKAPRPTPAANGVYSSSQPLTVEDDDDLIIPEIQPTIIKRPLEDDAEQPAAKKIRTIEAPINDASSKTDDDLVAVDVPSNGAIVLDD